MIDDNNISEMAILIAQKEFEPERISQTPFLDWNGRESVDCSDIEKLYLSYDFSAMPNRVISSLKTGKIAKQVQNYILYKKKQNQISRILISLLILFIVTLFLFAQGVVSNYLFYGTVVFLYLFSINYPAFIRKRLRRSRYLDLS